MSADALLAAAPSGALPLGARLRARRSMARTAFRSLFAHQVSFVFGLLATAFAVLSMLYLWRAVLAGALAAFLVSAVLVMTPRRRPTPDGVPPTPCRRCLGQAPGTSAARPGRRTSPVFVRFRTSGCGDESAQLWLTVLTMSRHLVGGTTTTFP